MENVSNNFVVGILCSVGIEEYRHLYYDYSQDNHKNIICGILEFPVFYHAVIKNLIAQSYTW